MGIKTAKFHADFESVEEIAKKVHAKKLQRKKMVEFITCGYSVENVTACNKWGEVSSKFFSRFEISIKFCVF